MKQKELNRNVPNIATQVKDLRKKNGLTQIEFARRVGVGLRFFRELEQGKTTVRMDKLTRVLDFLGYHLELRKNEPPILQAMRESGYHPGEVNQ